MSSDNLNKMTITIDNKEIEFFAGETIMQAAERAGSSFVKHIPRYCYHPGLSIAGTCRMCNVEIEKMPKLMTACSTPATHGMIIHTQNERVAKARKGVMEFLLINHPLDCPVCDQAGECDLQDYNFEYGPPSSRFTEEKRVFEEATTRHLSDKITLNMNRCVNCERCVRFEDEVTQTHDLIMLNRGWKKELTVSDEDKGLTSAYQGNLADICPVGALTFRDFRFKKRVWFLENKASICDGCSKGCSVQVESDHNMIYRIKPLYNEKVNGYWMCDEGRVLYHKRQDPKRLLLPTFNSWSEALLKSKEMIVKAKTILVLIGTDATLEEASSLLKHMPLLTDTKNTQIEFKYFNGYKAKHSEKEDSLLRMKDKTPNTLGLLGLGLQEYKGSKDKEADLVIIFKNTQAKLPADLFAHQGFIGMGVWTQSDWDNIANVYSFKNLILLPGPSTFEKSGTFLSGDGVEQKFEAALKPLAHVQDLSNILSALSSLSTSIRES